MDCRKFHQNLSVFIDGELDPLAAEAMARHLEGCPHCRDAHARLAELTRSLKTAAPTPPPFLAARVKARVAEVRARDESPSRMPAWNRLALMAMIALLAVGAGNLAGRSMEAIIGALPAESTIEIVMSDPGSSLADVVMDLGQEENGQ